MTEPVAEKSKLNRMVMKAIGLFGGVEVVGVVCSLLRNKFAALWLGEVGFGLFAIFNAALEMLNKVTTLGVRNSSVRDISTAHSAGDTDRVAKVVAVVRRWAMWLGLAGALLTISFAPALSYFSFGSTSYLWHFVALSLAVLFMSLTGGELAVLQGLSRLRPLAWVSMVGTVGGLLISLPLFYYLRERSVLPSILAYAACSTVAALVMRDRTTKPVKLSTREVAKTGQGFVMLGIFLTIGDFLTILMNYVFASWLNHRAGMAQVGLYQAGYAIIIKYTGMVFSALGMEFYPRLAAVVNNHIKLKTYVSQEVSITMFVLAPVVCLMVMLRTFVVPLLYKAQFIVVCDMVMWGMVGTVWRALSWCMAFVIIAKGDGKTYLVTEALSVVSGLALNMFFYDRWGLTGLGLSFGVWYVLYTVIVAVVYVWRYHLTMSLSSLANVAWVTVVAVAVSLCSSHSLTEAGWAITAAATALSLLLLYRNWNS